MDAELIGKFRHDSDEWHAARSEFVGASEAGIALGLSHWKSAYTLKAEKLGLVEPKEPDVKMKRKLAYGHHMEPFVAAEFAGNHPGLAVMETGTWRNKHRPWQGCNPDRLLALEGCADELIPHSVLELKTFPYLEDWSEGIPPLYRVQVLWQLDTFGYKRGYIAAYANMTGDYVEYEVEVDPFEMECIRDQVWEWASSDELPEIDGSVDTYETIRRLNPSIIRGKEVHIEPEIAYAYCKANVDLKSAEREANKWKGHLLAHMGTAQFALYGGKKIASRVAVKDGVPYLKET
jgi:putative phage-type endonuclease